MPAKYVLSRKASGFHWNLVATNGRVIATSEVYNSKQAALTGIRSVQKNGSTDVIVTAEELAAARPAKTTPAKSAKKAVAKPARAAKKAVAKPVKSVKKAVAGPARAATSTAKGTTAKGTAKRVSSARAAKPK